MIMTTTPEELGWHKLPPGFTIPFISPPREPLCSHAEYIPGVGWSLDCPAPATWTRPLTEWSDEYACGVHAPQMPPDWDAHPNPD
jgi:hypothetical protein